MEFGVDDYYNFLDKIPDEELARSMINAPSSESRFLIQSYFSSNKKREYRQENIQKLLDRNAETQGFFLED